MKLYDNDSFREQFTEIVYDLLSGDADNVRANQIISAFDSVPAVESIPVEIPFDELPSMDKRSIYIVCRDDPKQSGWAVLHAERILDELLFQLHFLDHRKQRIYLMKSNYHKPWVPCYREPVRAQACVFVSGERYRRLKADYDALKQELDARKEVSLDGTGPA